MKHIIFSLALVFCLVGASVASAQHAPTTNAAPQSPKPKPKTTPTPTAAKTAPALTSAQIATMDADKITISPAEWQELGVAKAAALKANPDLTAKANALAEKMRAYQQKLDAAIIQTDPRAAAVISMMENGRPGLGTHPVSPAVPPVSPGVPPPPVPAQTPIQ